MCHECWTMLRPGNGTAGTHLELLLSVGRDLQLLGQTLLSCQNVKVSAALSLNCLFILILGIANLCKQNFPSFSLYSLSFLAVHFFRSVFLNFFRSNPSYFSHFCITFFILRSQVAAKPLQSTTVHASE